MAVYGTYNVKMDTPRGFQPHILILKDVNGVLCGNTITVDIDRNQAFEGGTVEGNSFSFDMGGGLVYHGGVDEDTICGTYCFRDKFYGFYGTRAGE